MMSYSTNLLEDWLVHRLRHPQSVQFAGLIVRKLVDSDEPLRYRSRRENSRAMLLQYRLLDWLARNKSRPNLLNSELIPDAKMG
jgi:hypothetical protein